MNALKERGLCLFRSEQNDEDDPISIEPWSTTEDLKFENDVCSQFFSLRENPNRIVETDFISPLISYLWPLAESGSSVWTVDRQTTGKDVEPTKFVTKYDLLVWNRFLRSTSNFSQRNKSILFPKVLILTSDWPTCESIVEHFHKTKIESFKPIQVKCFYEAQRSEEDLEKMINEDRCDVLISTPGMMEKLTRKSFVDFEQIQLVIFDKVDVLATSFENLESLLDNLNENVQYLSFSCRYELSTKKFVSRRKKNFIFLSSSLLDGFSYRNLSIFCTSCRSLSERKTLVKDAVDLSIRLKKNLVICSSSMRNLTMLRKLLEDSSIEFSFFSSQNCEEELNRRKRGDSSIFLVEEDFLSEMKNFDSTEILLNFDLNRNFWFSSLNKRSTLFYRNLMEEESFPTFEQNFPNDFRQMKAENFRRSIIFLWDSEFGRSTFDLIDFLTANNYFLPTPVENFAKNFRESNRNEFCRTLKNFARCSNESKGKICFFRHKFSSNEEIRKFAADENLEFRIERRIDGNRVLANVFSDFYFQIDETPLRPAEKIFPDEILLFQDENQRFHRVLTVENGRKPVEKCFSLETAQIFDLKNSQNIFQLDNPKFIELPSRFVEMIFPEITAQDKISRRFTEFFEENFRNLTENRKLNGRVVFSNNFTVWVDRVTTEHSRQTTIEQKLQQLNLIENKTNDETNKPTRNQRGQIIVNSLGRSNILPQKHHFTSPPVGRGRTENFAAQEKVEEKAAADDEDDQMLFIFGPKLLSQLERIKQFELEQKHEKGFSSNRNRFRCSKNVEKSSRTKIFWEQTAREVFVTIDFKRFDSAKTKIEFSSRSIFCLTENRSAENFLRINLSEEIRPEKSSWKIRRNNILLTLKKSVEQQTWTKLNETPIEPDPNLFEVQYGSDDESENEKTRRHVENQWKTIRQQTKSNDENNEFAFSESSDDETSNKQNLTDVSSESSAPDSDDCYYEDQVPANHIPKGYGEADFDHRFFTESTDN